METTELRSKEDITRDIEETRDGVKEALHGAKDAWVGHNPAVVAWKATKSSVSNAKQKVVAKTQAANVAVQCNIYRSLGIALGVGAVLGVLLAGRRKRKLRNRGC
jgi:ElaB/YqjD/DUF883 family membrane-anchored ribosome-binding protein